MLLKRDCLIRPNRPRRRLAVFDGGRASLEARIDSAWLFDRPSSPHTHFIL